MTLTQLPGIGDVTAAVITDALGGEIPVYLRRLEATAGTSVAGAAATLRAAWARARARPARTARRLEG